MNVMKKQKWSKSRHHIFKWGLQAYFQPYTAIKYGFSFKPFKDVRNRPYLFLTNHQTTMDQFMFSMCFPKAVYSVATEDIFSIPLASAVIKWAVAPIPFIKSQKNVSTILTCKRIVKEGGSILMQPEGNRTYSGQTEYINPAVAKLAKMLKIPIGFMVLHGGYGVRPRWSKAPRKGKSFCQVEEVLEYEQYKDWTDVQLYDYICKKLYVDESCDGQKFYSKHLAEYVERAIYYCPKCGITHFWSKGDKFKCTTCGMEMVYHPDKQITLSNGQPAPYPNVKEWINGQNEYVQGLKIESCDTPVISDVASFYLTKLYKRKVLLNKDAKLDLYLDKLVVTKQDKVQTFSFLDDVTAMVAMGQNKLGITTKDNTYQIKGDVRFNPVKYVNLYYHFVAQNQKPKPTKEFLGF